MEYNFNVRGVDKGEAIKKMADKLDDLVLNKIIGVYSSTAICELAGNFIHRLPDDESKDVSVSITGFPDQHRKFRLLAGCGVSIHVELVVR